MVCGAIMTRGHKRSALAMMTNNSSSDEEPSWQVVLKPAPHEMDAPVLLQFINEFLWSMGFWTELSCDITKTADFPVRSVRIPLDRTAAMAICRSKSIYRLLLQYSAYISEALNQTIELGGLDDVMFDEATEKSQNDQNFDRVSATDELSPQESNEDSWSNDEEEEGIVNNTEIRPDEPPLKQSRSADGACAPRLLPPPREGSKSSDFYPAMCQVVKFLSQSTAIDEWPKSEQSMNRLLNDLSSTSPVLYFFATASPGLRTTTLETILNLLQRNRLMDKTAAYAWNIPNVFKFAGRQFGDLEEAAAEDAMIQHKQHQARSTTKIPTTTCPPANTALTPRAARTLVTLSEVHKAAGPTWYSYSLPEKTCQRLALVDSEGGAIFKAGIFKIISLMAKANKSSMTKMTKNFNKCCRMVELFCDRNASDPILCDFTSNSASRHLTYWMLRYFHVLQMIHLWEGKAFLQGPESFLTLKKGVPIKWRLENSWKDLEDFPKVQQHTEVKAKKAKVQQRAEVETKKTKVQQCAEVETKKTKKSYDWGRYELPKKIKEKLCVIDQLGGEIYKEAIFKFVRFYAGKTYVLLSFITLNAAVVASFKKAKGEKSIEIREGGKYQEVTYWMLRYFQVLHIVELPTCLQLIPDSLFFGSDFRFQWIDKWTRRFNTFPRVIPFDQNRIEHAVDFWFSKDIKNRTQALDRVVRTNLSDIDNGGGANFKPMAFQVLKILQASASPPAMKHDMHTFLVLELDGARGKEKRVIMKHGKHGSLLYWILRYFVCLEVLTLTGTCSLGLEEQDATEMLEWTWNRLRLDDIASRLFPPLPDYTRTTRSVSRNIQKFSMSKPRTTKKGSKQEAKEYAQLPKEADPPAKTPAPISIAHTPAQMSSSVTKESSTSLQQQNLVAAFPVPCSTAHIISSDLRMSSHGREASSAKVQHPALKKAPPAPANMVWDPANDAFVPDICNPSMQTIDDFPIKGPAESGALSPQIYPNPTPEANPQQPPGTCQLTLGHMYHQKTHSSTFQIHTLKRIENLPSVGEDDVIALSS